MSKVNNYYNEPPVDYGEETMKKHINGSNKVCFKYCRETSIFRPELFHEVDMKYETEDIQFALHTNKGSLTVLDRVTGFIGEPRDIETGFRDTNGNFWLASGAVDVRNSGSKTLGDAIQWVKDRANTCVPKIGE